MTIDIILSNNNGTITHVEIANKFRQDFIQWLKSEGHMLRVYYYNAEEN